MKKLTRIGIVAVLLLVLYNFLAFMIPFCRTEVFWISYGFTLAAFFVVGVSFYIAFGGKNSDAKSRFYGFPIARIGAVYGVVQFVLGLAFMSLAYYLPWWVAVIIQTAAFTIAAIGLIGSDIVLDEIKTQDNKLKDDVILMRFFQSKVNTLSVQCSDPNAAKAVDKLAEEFRFSDPVSNPSLASIERDLKSIIDELQQAVADSDSDNIINLCKRASATLAERNRLCKLSKGM